MIFNWIDLFRSVLSSVMIIVMKMPFLMKIVCKYWRNSGRICIVHWSIFVHMHWSYSVVEYSMNDNWLFSFINQPFQSIQLPMERRLSMPNIRVRILFYEWKNDFVCYSRVYQRYWNINENIRWRNSRSNRWGYLRWYHRSTINSTVSLCVDFSSSLAQDRWIGNVIELNDILNQLWITIIWWKLCNRFMINILRNSMSIKAIERTHIHRKSLVDCWYLFSLNNVKRKSNKSKD